MDTDSRTKAQVVDLLRYRQERGQRSLDFNGPPPPRPALALVMPFRPLSAREVSHRQRMLRHLEVRSQK